MIIYRKKAYVTSDWLRIEDPTTFAGSTPFLLNVQPQSNGFL